MDGPARLLVVYHSQSGSTQAMADAVIAGAHDDEIEGVEVRVREALAADVDDVLWCDAVILGTPENFGYMSGALKYFFDRVYHPLLEEAAALPYTLFVKAGNDGSGAVSSVRRILTGLHWREVLAPVVVVGKLEESHVAECRELGMTMAAGLEAGIF